MTWLSRVVEGLENREISFRAFVVTLLGVLFLRNFLETFADVGNMWTAVPPVGYLIHYPMFHLCVFVVMTITLRLLTGERIVKITRVALFFVPVVLLAPVLDLLLSRGAGYDMAYMFDDLSGLVRRYVRFTGGWSPWGVTPGIRIELAVVFLLLGLYAYLKTRSLMRVVAGLVALYTVGFALGALPSLLTIAWTGDPHAGGGEHLLAGSVVLNHFYTFNHKAALALLPVLVCGLGLWYRLHNRRRFTALLRNLRGPRVLHYACMLGFGMLIGHARQPEVHFLESPGPVLILIGSVISVVFAWWHAVGVNDLHDVEGDKAVNLSRPLVTGVVSARELGSFNAVLLVLSLLAAYVVRYVFFVPILVAIGLSYMYSAPPFRLKKVPFVATLVSALCSALVCLAGFVLFSDDYSFYGFPPNVLLVILVTFTLAFTVKDIKDLEADRIAGVMTLPILLGERKGKRVIGLLALAAYASVPLILRSLFLAPFALVFGVLTYVLVNRKRFQELPVFLSYFAFFAVAAYGVYRQVSGM